MKKIFLYLSFIIAFTFISCEENELLQYDNRGDKAAVQFVKTESNLRVNENMQATISIPVSVSTLSDSDRTVTIVIDTDLTSASQANYNLPSTTVTIPANSYEGTFDIVGIDDLNIDSEGKQIAIKIVSMEGANILDGFGTQIVKLFEICPNSFANLNLTFGPTGYASEISWDVKNSSNEVIANGGGYSNSDLVANEVIELQGPGEYKFTIYDSYGDGMWNGTTEGTYKLTLCVETLASGGGNFGSNQSTTFIKY